MYPSTKAGNRFSMLWRIRGSAGSPGPKAIIARPVADDGPGTGTAATHARSAGCSPCCDHHYPFRCAG